MAREDGKMGEQPGASKLPAWGLMVCSGLNIVFAAALAGVVATSLDNQVVKAGAPGVCLLNVKGQCCTFTYITAGAAMLFALLLLVPLALLHRNGAPLLGVYLSLSAFSFFWQLVMSLVITIRGRQAMSSGLPQQDAREQAWAFAWLGTVLSMFGGLIVIYDLIMEHRRGVKLARVASHKSLKIDSPDVLHTGVGIGSV